MTISNNLAGQLTVIAENATYSDALKAALIAELGKSDAEARKQETARTTQKDDNRRERWRTPLAVALTGLITLSGNFAFDYLKTDQVQNFNTDQATLDREAARTLQRDAAIADEKLRHDELEAQIGQQRLKFQFEVIESELAKFTEATDRANSLNLLIRMGVLGEKLDVAEIKRIIEEAKTNPDALPPVGNPTAQVQTAFSYVPCLDKSVIDKVDGQFLLLIMQNSGNGRAPALDRAEVLAKSIRNAMDSIGACTVPTIAAFISNILFESANLTILEEPGDGARYERRRDLGNTETGDGQFFKGRGMIQTTGRSNYAAIAKALGRPEIMDNPSLLATDPDLAALSAALYFRRRDLFKTCTPTDCDISAIRRGINGGLNGIVQVELFYVQAKALLSN